MGARPGRGRGLVALALLVAGCTEADYKSASFPPAQGPARPSVLLLYVFRPEGRGVPWGDAAFYHRETPAALGAVPLPFRASLDGGPASPAGARGDWVTRLSVGRHGLRVALPGREVLYGFETAADRTQVVLWSLEDGDRLVGVRGSYPRTELTAWPVDALAHQLERFRLFVAGLDRALAHGTEADFERLLVEDFRDPLGGRKDFARAAVHQQLAGAPWRVVGDAWLETVGERPRAHLALARAGRPAFPTLELVEDPEGPGGLRARSWY